MSTPSNYSILWPFDSEAWTEGNLTCNTCTQCGKRMRWQKTKCDSCRRSLGLKREFRRESPAARRSYFKAWRERCKSSPEGRVKRREKDAYVRLRKKGVPEETARAVAKMIAVDLELKCMVKK